MVSGKAFHPVSWLIMVIRSGTGFIAAAFLILCGCTDLTEFDHTLKAGLHIMYSPDLSVVNTIEDISGARALCVIPDCFLVATTEGTVIRFDLESHQQTGCFTIGSPSPSGYFEIEYSPSESSVYIIGALGQILEFHVPDMEFMNSFSVCETPVDIEIAVGEYYFYVAGATSSTIYEIHLWNDFASRQCLLLSSPTCMAIDQDQDTILVGTLAEPMVVSTGTTSMNRSALSHFPYLQAVETIPNDYNETRLFAVFGGPDYSMQMIATILYYFPPEFDNSCWVGTAPIVGDIHYICTDWYGEYAYVLSYIGDNKSRLICYNCSEYTIEDQVDLEGFPLDLEISSGGTLLVLTAE